MSTPPNMDELFQQVASAAMRRAVLDRVTDFLGQYISETLRVPVETEERLRPSPPWMVNEARAVDSVQYAMARRTQEDSRIEHDPDITEMIRQKIEVDSWGEFRREKRYEVLRAADKTLGEINAILEAEGFSEVFGEGVMPAPTQSHQIVRENKGAKDMINKLP